MKVGKHTKINPGDHILLEEEAIRDFINVDGDGEDFDMDELRGPHLVYWENNGSFEIEVSYADGEDSVQISVERTDIRAVLKSEFDLMLYKMRVLK